jgi:hypothetical protein
MTGQATDTWKRSGDGGTCEHIEEESISDEVEDRLDSHGVEVRQTGAKLLDVQRHPFVSMRTIRWEGEEQRNRGAEEQRERENIGVRCTYRSSSLDN